MRRIELLDYGRFFAATIVVFYHYTFNGIANGKISSISHVPLVVAFSKYGYLGVELFFMISGYVILYSAKNRSASQFAVSRAVRLYPGYWFSVIFTSLFAWHWGGHLMSVSLLEMLVNLTMFQSYLDIGHVDGVYWTLVYEVAFYAAVFLILFSGLQKSLDTIFVFWPILMCVAVVLNLQNLPFLGGYFYYFAAGALFAMLKERPCWRVGLSLLFAFALCVSFSSGKAESLSAYKGVEYSAYAIAAVITTFFIFFIVQNLKPIQNLRLPMSRTLGALTYPMYLIHAHFGYMFLSRFATEQNKALAYALTVSIVLAIAYAMHQFIEVRMHHVWKKVFSESIGRLITELQAVPRKVRLAYNKRVP